VHARDKMIIISLQGRQNKVRELKNKIILITPNIFFEKSDPLPNTH